ARAATGRELLLARHLEARAHRSAIGAPALADADALLHRAREAAAGRGKPEVGRWRRVVVVAAVAQVLVDAEGIDDLAGVHPAVRIPNPLELCECLNELRPEHLREHLRARLSVPVL